MKLRKKETATRTATIVICDDQDTVRSMFRKAFEKDGRLEVVGEAVNGKEALDVAAEHEPDALVLDFGMPETSGVEVLRALKERYPTMKIVVVSGFSAMGAEALEMGADAFVSKSDRVKDVIDALIQTLWHQEKGAPGATN